MKPSYIIILFIINCSWTIVNCNAQSVEALIQMAKEHNPGLEALRLDYNAARAKTAQVGDYPDPKLSLGLGILPVETRLGAQRFRIGASQQIPWKGLLDARRGLVTSKAEILSYMDEVKEIDIEYAIRTAYSSLVFLNNKKAIIESKLEILSTLEDLAKSSVRSGKGKLSNVLLIQRTKETIEYDLNLIEKQNEVPTIMINRWAGRDLSAAIEIEDLEPVESDLEMHMNYAESGHPQFQILENHIKASERAIDLTNFERKPKIGVGIEYGWIDKRDGLTIQGNGRDIIMPMGTISIPLHTGRFEAKKEEEKLKQEAILAKTEDLKEMYKSEIARANSEIEYSELEKTKLENLKLITEETIKLMRSEYASEGTRFEELLRLEMELIDYNLSIAKAEYQRLLAEATLKKYE